MPKGPLGLLAQVRATHLGAVTRLFAERYGERTAIEDEAATPGLHAGGVRTHLDLERHVGRLAAAHDAMGRGAGERVLVMTDNRIDVFLHAVALARVGAIAVPVNHRLKDAELAAVVTATSAVAAVADDEVADRLGTLEDPVLAGLAIVATGDRDGGGLAHWLAANPRSTRTAPDGADPLATALLLTTSGTTGMPKAAALTSRGLLSSAGLLALAPLGRPVGLRRGRDLMLGALPLTHVMGFAAILGAVASGVPYLHRDTFDPELLLGLIERRRPNIVIGVPTMYADLEAAGADERDLGSVQLWISGADVMPPDRARRFQHRGGAGRIAGREIGSATFVDGYGMVELSGAAAARIYPPTLVDRLELPSVAVALPGNRVRAVREDGTVARRGEVGELQFAGDGVTRGYEGMPDSGADADGWFATGDFGRVWAGGVFAFSGRSKDRLKVGGFSVFPAEVEGELRKHPDVVDVAVVGLPDDRLGERPVALVVTGQGDLDEQELVSWASANVAGYRRPRDCRIVASLPRGNNGKLDRAAATAQAVALFS